MHGFWVANFYHTYPMQVQPNGNTVYVSRSCFGPLEHIAYGMDTSGRYYCAHTYPLAFDETDLQCDIIYLQKQEILSILTEEMAICQAQKQETFHNHLQQIKQGIQDK